MTRWTTQSVEWQRETTGSSSGQWGCGRTIAGEVYAGRMGQNSGLTALAYCWRRFGPPISGSDDHKDLVAYLLTTPAPDVWLWLHLSASEIDLAVGAIMTKPVYERILKPMRDWGQKRREWLERTYLGLNPELKPTMNRWKSLRKKKKDEIREAFESWKRERDEVEDRIWELGRKATRTADEDRERRRLSRGFKRFPVPLPARDEETPAGTRVQRAIRAALQDLLRPVYVQDVPINVFGRMRDEDVDHKRVVGRSRYAGLGVPVKALDKLLTEPAP